jgi:Ni,Fe-hydrogenase III small subunit/formate hydrogenlyase subunit 6/NADH:ubiquinone oxidoreductase subunit I
MFKILQKSFKTGIVTSTYPKTPARVSGNFRGRPEFDFERWRDARPAAEACPTGAITVRDDDGSRLVTVDYGLCVFCGQCADVSPDGAVRVTKEFELAVSDRRDLVLAAEYALHPDGSHRQLTASGVAAAGRKLDQNIRRVLGRSLAIRQVDAGSCNGCELEIVALNNPVHDIERFGIHFVASPRHADMLLVTGPVTRNMELALRKTYDAAPEPKLVVAVGACGISGGIFGTNYATRGAVDQVIPVDVYIPGCPPRPEALLYGILLAVGRLTRRT